MTFLFLKYLSSGRLAGLLGSAVLVLAFASPALAQEDSAPSLDRGLDARAGAGFVPAVVGAAYQGPSNEGFDPEPGEPALPEELHQKTNAVSLGGELWFGLGFRDGRGNRFGLDASAMVLQRVSGGTGIPVTQIVTAWVATVGPAYTRTLSPRWDLDVSLRGAVNAFTGAQADYASYDNVYEFSPHFGFLGRIGIGRRFALGGPTALTLSVFGGPQFASHQTAYVGGLSLGFQVD